jgi:cation-transporting ATPase E
LKIISGDHPATVAALARDAGVPGAGRAISGLELDASGPLEHAVNGHTVFGRISPDQKSRIVEALQRQDRYVAMIGDGVNDVPALKRSEVAISMRTSSAVTRSISDIILLEDSFSALPAAFSEGRRIRSGMQATMRIFLVRTLSVSIVISAVALLSSEFPLTPRHTALLSALTVGIPAFCLALWARPAPTSTYLIPSSLPFVAPAALLLGVMGTAVFELALESEDVDTARTALTIAATIAGVLLLPFADDDAALWMRWRGVVNALQNALLAAAMLVLLVLVAVFGPLRDFYELSSIDAQVAGIVAGGVVFWLAALAASWAVLEHAPSFSDARSQQPP